MTLPVDVLTARPAAAPGGGAAAVGRVVDDRLPQASIIIPTLNEEAHIGPLLDQLLQDVSASVVEIIVADGGSTDDTVAIVSRISHDHPRVRLIHNAKRIQAAGVNAGARGSDEASDVLIRIDAHAVYPRGFVRSLLEEMARPELDSVVVRMNTVGRSCFGRAVAFVSNSRIGTGGAAHRMGSSEGYVDHGHHAAFRRAAFLALGGYDEAFRTNEDAEFDHRLGLGGGRIWLSNRTAVEYIPRDTPSRLARQYFRYGVGRAMNVMKHGHKPRLRQLLPAMLVAYAVVAMPLTAFVTTLALAPLALYAAVVAAAAATAWAANRTVCALGVLVALPVMHVAWGVGFLLTLARSVLGTGANRSAGHAPP